MGVHVEWASAHHFHSSVARPNERMLDDQAVDGNKIALILGGDDLVVIEGTQEALLAKLRSAIAQIENADTDPCCKACGIDDLDREPLTGRQYCGPCILERCGSGDGDSVGLPTPPDRAAVEAALVAHIAQCELRDVDCPVCQLGTEECSECSLVVDDEDFDDVPHIHGTVVIDPGDQMEGRYERRVVTYGCEGYAHPIVRAAAVAAGLVPQVVTA